MVLRSGDEAPGGIFCSFWLKPLKLFFSAFPDFFQQLDQHEMDQNGQFSDLFDTHFLDQNENQPGGRSWSSDCRQHA